MSFTLAAPADVDLAVYDVSGRRVRTLERGRLAAGQHRFRWDGRDGDGHDVAPGVLFVKLASGATQTTSKIVKLR